jgi:acetyl esterase/lipase
LFLRLIVMLRERKRLTNPRGLRLGAGLVAVSALLAASMRRSRKLRKVSLDLRSPALILMPVVHPLLVPLMRYMARQGASLITDPPGLAVSEHWVSSCGGDPDVRIVILRRAEQTRVGRQPALLWLHGGGYVVGTPEIDFTLLARILEATDITIVSVDYRLAPRDPFPAPLDDAMAVLRWVIDQREAHGIDPARVAVGGNSAGGGLAAGLAQRARDEGISLTFQLLMYPMLDDRTACRTDHDGRGELIWNPRSNRHGWRSYLGHEPGTDRTALYAAPLRTKKLTNLPPAWIGVGSLDLFFSEDVAYAGRLRDANVPCELDVVADAPHAFDLLSFNAETSRLFHGRMIAGLVSSYKK